MDPISMSALETAEYSIQMLASSLLAIANQEDEEFNQKIVQLHRQLVEKSDEQIRDSENLIDELNERKRILLSQQNRLKIETYRQISEQTDLHFPDSQPINQAKETITKKLKLTQKALGELEEETVVCQKTIRQESSNIVQIKVSISKLNHKIEKMNLSLSELDKVDDLEPVQAEVIELQSRIEETEQKIAELFQIKKTSSFSPKELLSSRQEYRNQIFKKVHSILDTLSAFETKPGPTIIYHGQTAELDEGAELLGLTQKTVNQVMDLQSRLILLEASISELEGLKKQQANAKAKLKLTLNSIRIKKEREKELYGLKEEKKKKTSIISANKSIINKAQSELKRQEFLIKGLKEKTLIYQTLLDDLDRLEEKSRIKDQEIKELVNMRQSIPDAASIWQKSLERRIKLLRSEINKGNPFLVVFFPRRKAYRLSLNTHIRHDLIEVERQFEKLGILAKSYLEEVEFFNRRDRNGQQLSVEILDL